MQAYFQINDTGQILQKSIDGFSDIFPGTGQQLAPVFTAPHFYSHLQNIMHTLVPGTIANLITTVQIAEKQEFLAECNVLISSLPAEQKRYTIILRSITPNTVQKAVQTLLDSADIGISMSDLSLPDMPLVYVNQGFEKITGYSANDVIGRNCRFLQDDHTDQIQLEIIRAAMKQGKSCTVTLRNRRKDGQIFMNSLKLLPVFDQNSAKITQYIGLQHDITEHSVLDAQHKLFTETLQRILLAKRLIVLYTDEHGKIMLASGALLEMLRLNPEEFIGSPVTTLFGADAELLHSLQEALEGNEIRLRKKFLGLHWDISLQPIYEGIYAGGCMIIAADITQELISQERVLHSEKKYKNLTELSSEPIFMAQISGKLAEVNPSFCSVSGYTQKELLLMSYSDLLFIETDHGNMPWLLDGKPSAVLERHELKLLNREGTIIPMRASVRMIDTDIFICTLQDITLEIQNRMRIERLIQNLVETNETIRLQMDEKSRYAESLEKTSQLRNEFISHVSHELRTPLASILGFSQTLLSDPRIEPALRDKFIQIIFEEGNKLARMVEDLLDFSRIERGKAKLDLMQVEMTAFCADIVKPYQQLCKEKMVEFILDFPQTSVFANCDMNKMRRVLQSILDNAVKFTPSEGRIYFKLLASMECLEFIIQDSGPGIPDPEKEALFNVFQTGSSVNEEDKGTGLGLAIARGLARLHQGEILISDPELGTGAVFTVKIPIDLA
jgi:two-component system CheB/CheR fusion protein